jgi:N-acetyl-gamma-glutamyl-phosphate reductase
VVVRTDSPNTKATLGANTAHVTALLDERTGYVVALCALDNLVKGASGQAIQCANLICGLDETSGLPSIGLMP